ncbi:hypothetical protein [Acinetobacter sp. YH12231]|uniref:hypothetical protein n=1 Tax=Acinetobacter sp. YH12231 TaxID=2601160 RepID=UPI0015D1DF65|nr:hypothetical protein [Acinetobacter sp. YH12231]
MSNIVSLIENLKKSKTELIASTIRMPESLHTFIETLAIDLNMSKQETMLQLLEHGAEAAQKALSKVEEKEMLKDKESEINYRFHLLNTNKSHSEDDSKWMIQNGFAAAFYSPWKHNIERINLNDVVFLYENGKGIVGYGKGTGEVEKCDHNEKKDECFYQKLSDFKLFEKPISASDVKKILDRNVVFLRTMSGIPDGNKILDFIETKKNN